MSRFTRDNTQGSYSDEQLAELNRRFETKRNQQAEWIKPGCTSQRGGYLAVGDVSWLDHIAEQVRTNYDTELSAQAPPAPQPSPLVGALRNWCPRGTRVYVLERKSRTGALAYLRLLVATVGGGRITEVTSYVASLLLSTTRPCLETTDLGEIVARARCLEPGRPYVQDLSAALYDYASNQLEYVPL